MEKNKKILIVCGEQSGDTHAAHLVSAIKAIDPSIKFWGLGGRLLSAQGVELSFDLTSIAVVGFFEVLKHIFLFKKIFNDVLKKADSQRPDLAILVDYPGFNLRLAQALAKRNIPVIYYISPQIWAWGKNRINTIKKAVSKMIVLFKFEEDMYKKAGVPVFFAGHPLLDIVKTKTDRKSFLSDLDLDPDKITISLLPGSREKEVKTLLPVMLDSAKIISAYLPDKVQFLVLAAPNLDRNVFTGYLKDHQLPLKTVTDSTYDGISASDFAMVCSGTATLETAIIGTPMIILYKLNLLSWFFIRLMIRLPYIGLVNVVKRKKVIGEFIQFDCKPQAICDHILPLLHDKNRLNSIRKELHSIKDDLGQPGATQRAAKAIVDYLQTAAESASPA